MEIVEGCVFLMFDIFSTMYTKYVHYLILFEAACLIERDLGTITIQVIVYMHSHSTKLIYYYRLGDLGLLITDHPCICLCHSSQNSPEIVTVLVTTGQADVNSKDKDGETPLHKAYE